MKKLMAILLLLPVAFACRADPTDGRPYEGSVRMHTSPFAPDTHDVQDEDQEAAPAPISHKGYAPPSSANPVPYDSLPVLQPKPPLDPIKEKEIRKQENWITPASTVTQKEDEEEAKPSGWGWLADEAARKIDENQKKEEEDAEAEEENEENAYGSQRYGVQENKDPGYFISSDYFNNAGVFDTSSHFDEKEDEKNDSTLQPAGGDIIKPSVEDRNAVADELNAEDADRFGSDAGGSRIGPGAAASLTGERGLSASHSDFTAAKFDSSPDFTTTRDNNPLPKSAAISFTPPAARAAVRIPTAGAEASAGFGSFAAPPTSMQPAGFGRPSSPAGLDSPLSRPSLLQPQGFAPAGSSPASSGLPSADNGPGQSIFDSREDSGMRLLPR